jgi:hypothetical protein
MNVILSCITLNNDDDDDDNNDAITAMSVSKKQS